MNSVKLLFPITFSVWTCRWTECHAECESCSNYLSVYPSIYLCSLITLSLSVVWCDWSEWKWVGFVIWTCWMRSFLYGFDLLISITDKADSALYHRGNPFSPTQCPWPSYREEHNMPWLKATATNQPVDHYRITPHALFMEYMVYVLCIVCKCHKYLHMQDLFIYLFLLDCQNPYFSSNKNDNCKSLTELNMQHRVVKYQQHIRLIFESFYIIFKQHLFNSTPILINLHCAW